MKITCFIEYQIDSTKLALFKEYADNWSRIIPQCGGELLGYFAPYEGTNNIGYGLISFDSLADYERYRSRLKQSEQGKSNFSFAQKDKFILSEKRTFLEVVPSTYPLSEEGDLQ